MKNENQNRCVACGSSLATKVGRTVAIGGEETDLLQCDDCGTVYRWPRPLTEDVDAFYEGSTSFNPPPGKYGMWIREKTAKGRIDTFAKMIENEGIALNDCLFLDVGAGIGLHCKEATKIGFKNPVGFEPREWACEFGREKFGVTLNRTLADHQALYETINSDKEATSVLIFCSHVLEHIVEPEEFLKMFNGLKINGKKIFVAILVPHVSSETRGHNGKTISNLWEQHMQSFSCDGLSRLFERISWRETLSEKRNNRLRWKAQQLTNIGAQHGRVPANLCRILSKYIRTIGTIVGKECCKDHPVEIRIAAELPK